MVRWRLCTDSSYFQNNTMMQNKKNISHHANDLSMHKLYRLANRLHTTASLSVCNKCIGYLVHYILTPTYYYIHSRKKEPILVLPFFTFQGGNAADLGPDLEVHRYDVLRCIAYLQFQIQTLHRSCKVVGIFSGIAEA